MPVKFYAKVQSGEPVSILLVPAIFLGTVLTHLCGGSAGREGAALQMGGSIGWNVGTLLHLKDHDRRTATISGMAAFFSALFGTPLTAALFAMMVEDVGLTFTSAFVPAFTSALIAYGCSLAFGIAPTHFAITAPELTVWSAFLVILLGFACAAVSRLFCGLLHFMEHKVPQLLPNPWLRVFVGGVAVIDYDKCKGCGMCAQKCPKKIILFPLKDDPYPPKPVVKPAAPAAKPAATAAPAAKPEAKAEEAKPEVKAEAKTETKAE